MHDLLGELFAEVSTPPKKQLVQPSAPLQAGLSFDSFLDQALAAAVKPHGASKQAADVDFFAAWNL
eukprot:3214846-Amphidinium_carterae.1